MVTITANGETEMFGNISVTISGEKFVKKIICNSEFVRKIMKSAIKNSEGWIANGYHPESNTMLQAFAYCQNVFGYKNVTVNGELETIEQYDDDVIY